MEQPDGTFVSWAGLSETIGVDYVEDRPEHARTAAMFALKRKSFPRRVLDSRLGVRDADAHVDGDPARLTPTRHAAYMT